MPNRAKAIWTGSSLAFLALWTVVRPAWGAEREWTSADGDFKVMATFVGLEDKATAILKRRDGQEVNVALASLSQEDLTFMESQRADVPKFANSLERRLSRTRRLPRAPERKAPAAIAFGEYSDVEGGPVATFRIPGDYSPRLVATSADGKRIVVNSDKVLTCLDLETGRRARHNFDRDSTQCLALSRDGGRCLVGLSNGDILVVDFAADLEAAAQTARWSIHDRPVNNVAISPDGKRALSVSEGVVAFTAFNSPKKDKSSIVHWEIEAGEPIGSYGELKTNAKTCRFSSDGRHGVVALEDAIMHIDLKRDKVTRTDPSTDQRLESVQISECGTRFLDKDSRVWFLTEPDGTRRSFSLGEDLFAYHDVQAYAVGSFDRVFLSVRNNDNAELLEFSRSGTYLGTVASWKHDYKTRLMTILPDLEHFLFVEQSSDYRSINVEVRRMRRKE